MIGEIGRLPMNPQLVGQAEVLRDIVYSQNGQTLTLLLPWAPQKDRRKVFRRAPLLLFVQGSSWKTPNINYEIPMLSHFAEKGIAVATVSHRSTAEGHPFPAFLQDVKCAIRFLRAHADEYALNTEKITAFGTSSGGHTVCMLGLTGDDARYRTAEYPMESDRVDQVVACFAPTELQELFYANPDETLIHAWLTALFGADQTKWPEKLEEFSPVRQVKDGAQYPPFLLLNGTGDNVVPHTQMERLYEKLKAHGTPVKAYYVEGAEHEGNFWSPEVRKVIDEAITGFLL